WRREPKPPHPMGSSVVGLARRLPGAGYHHSAELACCPATWSAAGAFGFLLPLRRLSPPSRKISEFSTRRSAMAVAMVVLKRMLPQSENVVLVVIMVLRLRLCRVEMTW